MIRTAAVVGTGLIGTSAALALAQRGVRVHLIDTDESALRTAVALGAGVPGPPGHPVDIALLAVPPGLVGQVLADQQNRGLAAAYTDVASVKGGPEHDVLANGADPATYIGGHPMAGRERSGPLAACATLFEQRTWVLTPSPATTRDTLNRALEAIALCGAIPLLMDSGAHDRAVATVSHAPHLVSALMAAQLETISDPAARLAGQGLRDVIRIAGSDTALWGDILQANAAAVADVLAGLATDLDTAVAALRDLADGDPHQQAKATTRLTDLLTRGVRGHRRIPGKHGSQSPDCRPVRILIGDQPGELSRLLAATSDLSVNVEDMTIDHSPGHPTGLVELMVASTAAWTLAERLKGCGWHVQRHPHTTAPAQTPAAA